MVRNLWTLCESAESKDDGNDTETKDDKKNPSSTADETEGEDDRSGSSDNDLIEDTDGNKSVAASGSDGDTDEDDGGFGSLLWLVNAMLRLTTVVWAAGLSVLIWTP